MFRPLNLPNFSSIYLCAIPTERAPLGPTPYLLGREIGRFSLPLRALRRVVVAVSRAFGARCAHRVVLRLRVALWPRSRLAAGFNEVRGDSMLLGNRL